MSAWRFSTLFSQARVEVETLVDSLITQHARNIKLEPQVFYISIHFSMLSASSTARGRLFFWKSVQKILVANCYDIKETITPVV